MEYSKAEIRLITTLGCNYLIKCNLMPPVLYRMLIEKAFLENLSGPAVEALRRGAKALFSCAPYRLTPEFDQLVTFEGE